MKEENGVWSEPKLASFSSDHYDGDFTLSPDGRKLLFSSARPLQEGGEPTRPSNLWVVERSGSGWTAPRALGSFINTEHHESYPTVTSNGTLYFFARERGGFGEADLFVARRVDAEYGEPENLGPTVNTEFNEYDPFVAPDESYLIFASTRTGSLGKDDLYISFRGNDGSWSAPAHMAKGVNSQASENRAYVTADQKYLIFTSDRKASGPDIEHPDDGKRPGNGSRDIYWVDAKILESYRP
jgi:Tol biopolymer transport system component